MNAIDSIDGLLFVAAWIAFALIALSAGPIFRHLKWRRRARKRRALDLEIPGHIRVGLDRKKL